ncbi:SatD family protein [Psychroserpens sp. S379A]|uniref:SatD family protein n=1 Tax=Psychroserpens sp. S379A TaxID=3415137 RepID=UPI003C7BC895
MVAVITGDIINSRKEEVKNWLGTLKGILNYYGEEPKDWEIFRGDSFQLLIAPEKAMLCAIHIKSAIKQIKSLDVRMAIGIGNEKYKSSKITESNGSAYIRSGDCFEALKKQTLAIKSNNENFDETINVMLSLSLLIANNWSSTVAEVIKTTIENSNKNQNYLAQLLNKSQSSISEALKRGGFEEIMNMNNFYVKQISKL